MGMKVRAVCGVPVVRPMRERLAAAGNCTKPDRHEPGLYCGYPTPCPFHAPPQKGTFDMTEDPPSLITLLRRAWRTQNGRVAIIGAAGLTIWALAADYALSAPPSPALVPDLDPKRPPSFTHRMTMRMDPPEREIDDIVIAPVGGALPFDY